MEKLIISSTIAGVKGILIRYDDRLNDMNFKNHRDFIVFLHHLNFLLFIQRARINPNLFKSMKIMSKMLKNYYPQLNNRQCNKIFIEDHVRINKKYFSKEFIEFKECQERQKFIIEGEPVAYIKMFINDYVVEPKYNDIVTIINLLDRMIFCADLSVRAFELTYYKR